MDHAKRQRLFWLQWVPGRLGHFCAVCSIVDNFSIHALLYCCIPLQSVAFLPLWCVEAITPLLFFSMLVATLEFYFRMLTRWSSLDSHGSSEERVALLVAMASSSAIWLVEVVVAVHETTLSYSLPSRKHLSSQCRCASPLPTNDSFQRSDSVRLECSILVVLFPSRCKLKCF